MKNNQDPPTLELLLLYKRQITSLDIPQQEKEQIIENIRKFSSVESNPPLEMMVQANFIPDMINICSQNETSDKTRLDILWIITNIASGNFELTNYIVENGGIDFLLKHVAYFQAEIVEQALWGLGNIAGENTKYRDIILQQSAVDIILNAAKRFENTSISFFRNLTWVLSNLNRGKPNPKYYLVKNSLPFLIKQISDSNQDCEVIQDSLWALAYISDNCNQAIQDIIAIGAIPLLVPFLSNKNYLTPALRALGNTATGEDSAVDEIIKHNILPIIVDLLQHTKTSIRKESCWFLSNIAAGTQQQVDKLMQTPHFLDNIKDILNYGQAEIRKEALWVVSNILTGGTSQNKETILQQQLILDSTTALQFLQFLNISQQVFVEGLNNAVQFLLQDVEKYNQIEILNQFEQSYQIFNEGQQYFNTQQYDIAFQSYQSLFNSFSIFNDLKDDLIVNKTNKKVQYKKNKKVNKKLQNNGKTTKKIETNEQEIENRSDKSNDNEEKVENYSDYESDEESENQDGNPQISDADKQQQEALQKQMQNQCAIQNLFEQNANCQLFKQQNLQPNLENALPGAAIPPEQIPLDDFKDNNAASAAPNPN